MKNIPTYALLDLDSISRWHMVNTTAPDTVASHSFRVAMIAIAIQMELDPNDEEAIKDLAYHSLFHDAEEAYSGDIATHAKAKIQASGVDLEAIFGRGSDMPDYISQIIKIADKMDALLFIDAHGVGPRAADALTYNISKYFQFVEDTKHESLKNAAKVVFKNIKARGEFL